MHFIVETEDQLHKIISYKNDSIFMEPVWADDRVHPAINSVSAIYFRNTRGKRGFLIPIDHTESPGLDLERVLALFLLKVPQISTIDRKVALYLGLENRSVKGLKMAYTLNGESFPELSDFDTTAHLYYQRQLSSKTDVNRYVPLSKIYEKYENFYKKLKFKDQWFTSRDYEFYNQEVTDVFFNIEKSGIGIDMDHLKTVYPDMNYKLGVGNGRIYGIYNLFNLTGRPTCAFNGVNFSAISKKDDRRKMYIPRNQVLVEFDYQAYQIKLLADIIGYDFQGENIHRHMAKLYYNTEDPTEQQYADGKLKTFRYLFAHTSDSPDTEFFKEVFELKDYLWDRYQQYGYIKSPISGRKLTGMDNDRQILPYLLQSYETESNVQVLSKILKYLEDKDTKLIMYSYDAFLFDLCVNDGKDLVTDIRDILEEGDYKTKASFGANYLELEELFLD